MFGFLKRSAAKPSGNIFLFVGRGQLPENLLSLYEKNKSISSKYNIHVISPESEWYPKPSGVTNQSHSLAKLKATEANVSKMIQEICDRDGLKQSECILSGFSSGAVLAFSLWMNGHYETMISHSGCILDVKDVKGNKGHKECLLIHNRDDDCFTWEERYMPTKSSLVSGGYDVSTVERCFGGHTMSSMDVAYVAAYLNLV